MNRTFTSTVLAAIARTVSATKLSWACKASFTAVLTKRNVVLGLITLVFLLNPGVTHAQDGLLMIGAIDVDSNDAAITPSKLESALGYAVESSGIARLIPSFQRDSVLKAKFGGKSMDIAEGARALEATGVVFARAQRLSNLLRVEISMNAGYRFDISKTGIGYALIRHKQGGKLLIDPALLEATQRAFMMAYGDSTLYVKADSGFNVQRTTPLAIGGIEYIGNDNLPSWSLFKGKVVSSFDIVNTMVQELSTHPRYTVIDIETRDSMMAMGNIYYIENYNTVATTELRILHVFDIVTVITGKFERITEGAKLTLTLNSVTPTFTLTPLKSESSVIKEDTKEALANAVRNLTGKLTGLTTSQR